MRIFVAKFIWKMWKDFDVARLAVQNNPKIRKEAAKLGYRLEAKWPSKVYYEGCDATTR